MWKKRSLGSPSINKYYRAAILSAMLDWYSDLFSNRGDLNSLSEYRTKCRPHEGLGKDGKNKWLQHNTLCSIGKLLIGTWDWCQKYLAPLQSPLLTFINHPDFKAVRQNSTFTLWYVTGFVTLGILSSIIHLYL